MSIWDDIANWFKTSKVDNNIAANIPILGSYYNTAFPAPPQPQQKVVIPPGAQPNQSGTGLSKNINLPQPQRDAAMQQAILAKLSQFNNAPQQPQIPQQSQNPVMDQLMTQLMNNLNPKVQPLPKPPTYTYDQLYDKYYDIINSQYEPRINDILQNIEDKRMRYGQSAADIEALYASAGGAFGGGNGTDFDQLRADENSRLANYQNYTNNVYSDSASRMNEEFNQLGIGDVAQYSSPKQAEDLAYLQTLNQNSSDAFQRFLSSMEAASGGYDQSMSNSYGLAGAEQVDDLRFEENQFYDESDRQLADLRSEQDSALNALIMQKLMSQEDAQYNWQLQNTQNQQASQNAIFERLLALAGLQRQIDQSATSGIANPMDALNQQYKQLQIQQLQQKLVGGSQQPQNYTKGLLGATQYLGQNSGNAQNLTALMQQLLQQQEFREDRFVSGSGDLLQMTPEQAAQYAMQMAQAQKLSPQDTNALINAIYAYYGRLQ